MSNLKRYSERENKFGVEQLLPTENGEYVKFDDIKELLQTAQNTASPQLPPLPCLECETWEYCRSMGVGVYSVVCKIKYHRRQLSGIA